MGRPMKLMATEISRSPTSPFEFPKADGEQEETKEANEVA